MQESMSDLDPVAIDPVTHALAGAFRRSPIAMVVFSAEGIVEHANDAMARLLDVTAASLIGRTVDSVVHPDDVDMIGRFAQFDSDREPVALDHRVIRSDGEVRWLRSTVVALARGETHSFFVQSVDHTASRRQDIQLRSIDAVTGLLSRDGLMAKFDDLVAAHQGRSIAPYALFAVDIDDFRGVNDRLGTLAADRALYLVGACIRAALPVGVAVARVGADVFVALAPGMEAGEATLAVERLLAGLTVSSIGLGLPVLGYKLGAVAVAGTDVDPAAAVQLVEQRAQDPATTSEGGAAEITSGSSALVSSAAQSLEVSEWAAALAIAIEAGAYIAVGEPLRAMSAGLAPLERFELFVRLVLPDHKWVSLPKFEPHALRLGRGADVDRWMVTFAVGMLRSNPNLELEVNVSKATLQDLAFTDHLAHEVRAQRRRCGSPPTGGDGARRGRQRPRGAHVLRGDQSGRRRHLPRRTRIGRRRSAVPEPHRSEAGEDHRQVRPRRQAERLRSGDGRRARAGREASSASRSQRRSSPTTRSTRSWPRSGSTWPRVASSATPPGSRIRCDSGAAAFVARLRSTGRHVRQTGSVRYQEVTADRAAGHVVGHDPHPTVARAWCPWVDRERGQCLDLGRIRHLVQRPADEDAPARFGDVIRVVRLERHSRSVAELEQRGVGVGAEHDRPVGDRAVHRQCPWLTVLAEHDSPERRSGEQPPAHVVDELVVTDDVLGIVRGRLHQLLLRPLPSSPSASDHARALRPSHQVARPSYRHSADAHWARRRSRKAHMAMRGGDAEIDPRWCGSRERAC